MGLGVIAEPDMEPARETLGRGPLPENEEPALPVPTAPGRMVSIAEVFITPALTGTEDTEDASPCNCMVAGVAMPPAS